MQILAKIKEKLAEKVLDNLSKMEFKDLNSFEEKVLKQLTSGKDALVYSASFKLDQILLFSSLLRAPESQEGCPRVIIITPTSERAVFLKNWFEKALFRTEIHLELANEKGNIIEQRNSLFSGAEIIIGTPKRSFELYLQNGINLSQMKLFILEDADQMVKFSTDLIRIIEGLPKCQRFIFAQQDHPKLEKMRELTLQAWDEIEYSEE
jgi:superfamily II DNA/RNA helicase